MKKRILATIMAAVMMSFTLAGCGTGEQKEEKASDAGGADKADDKVEIAYIVKAKTDEFWTNMEKGAYAYAKEHGVELSFQAPEKETDVEKQVQMVENSVIKGVDAIILSAADSKSLIPSIKKANDADIPVILVNDTIDEDALAAEGGRLKLMSGLTSTKQQL